MNPPIYQTALEDIVESPSGRYKFAPGKRVCRLPFVDRKTGLRAHVTYATALLAAAAVGGRLPTAAEEEILAKQAFWIKPNIVRETPEERAQRIAEGLDDRYSLRLMGTQAWAERGDKIAVDQLVSWDGDRPVLNWGKAWVAEDLAGHAPGPAQAFNEGWDDDPNPARTHWIQTVGGVHNRLHVDYSQVLWVVWDEDLESDPPVAAEIAKEPGQFAFACVLDAIGGVVARAEKFLLDRWNEMQRAPTPKPPAAVAVGGAEFPFVARFVPTVHCRALPAGKVRDIRNVVIHTAECGETHTAAEGLGAFFAAPKTGVSAHFSVDDDSIVQSVKMNDEAWAAPPLNDEGVHIELAGYAAQTAAQWNDDFSKRQLALCAKLVRAICDRFALPIEFVDVAGLRAGKKGITFHKTVSDAFKQSNHQDPGANFPLEAFIAQVRASV
jgi:hypothetical protein